MQVDNQNLENSEAHIKRVEDGSKLCTGLASMVIIHKTQMEGLKDGSVSNLLALLNQFVDEVNSH